MANRIQLRRGNGNDWTTSNPILAQGELGVELDTGRIKIGDGVTSWSSLRYERPVESIAPTGNTLVQRDANGDFSANIITATLTGNASTATRLSNSRQIQIAGDVVATGNFDGSANLTLNSTLSDLNTLPHYASATEEVEYTKVTVNKQGRVVNAANPTTIQGYGLDTGIEGTGAQPYDGTLNSIASLTTAGFIGRIGSGAVNTRTLTGTSSRIEIINGDGVNGNPTFDLHETTVVPNFPTYTDGDYNIPSLTSVDAVGTKGERLWSGVDTVNSVHFTVDMYGRLTYAYNVPIATATEGSKYANYDGATAYSRYAIIQNASKVYQAYEAISAGAGAPTHTSGDNGGWRYLAAEATEQKGLASFAQEDFDVDSNGHVTIAALGVDNTQLQNNRVSFADGNTKEDFELDQELTATTGYRGFNYLNYVKVNDTSGNLLFGANNTGDSGAGEIDVNVRSYYSDPNIDLDGAVDQIIDKYGSGHFTISHTQNVATPRNLNILATNSGAGSANIVITSDDTVQISASDAAGKVHVEDARFQDNYIATTNATMNLDPGDDRAVSGLVRVWGDLQVDGVTTTVNSTTLQVDDPIITLGGDTAPVSDDNKDRGVEFSYYDTQARVGFYGWDTNYTDLGGHEGGYRFLHAATNTSEVFAGTDSGIIAGNVKLTTGTNSTSNTTGDLVVAGGAGITQDVNIGGLLDVDGTLRVTSTSRFDDSMVIQGASKTLQLNNGSGTTRVELQSTTGNASFFGVVDITNNLNVNTNMFNVTASNGNTQIAGAVDANSTLNVAGAVHFEDTDEPTWALNSGTGVWEIQGGDYGSFRFDGGGYIEGDFMFNSDVVINGTILQREDSTEVFNEQNFLKVRRKLQAGSQQELIPDYASHTNANLKVFGGAGIRRSLHIGARQSGEGLFIGKLNSGNDIEFQVIGDTGNTTIGRSGAGSATEGLLTVYGDTLLDRDLTVNGSQITLGNASSDVLTVNADATFTDNITVNQSAEFDSSINVDGDATFQSNVTINGDNLTFTIEAQNGTDAFTVDSDNGNTVIAGTLDVDDATTITNTLNVTNGVDFDSTLNVDGAATFQDNVTINADNKTFAIQNNSNVDKFTVDTDNGNTAIQGTVTIQGATQINDTVSITNVTSITASSQQTLTGSYAADGAFRLTGGAGIQKNLAVGGAARIYGATELTGALDLNSSADISGALVTHDDVTITADNKFFKIQNGSAADKFTVDTDNGNIVSQGTLTVAGDTALQSDLTVTGNLVVNGTTTTVNSTTTTLDDPIITLGGDTAPASNDGKDRGVEFRYYDGSAKVGFFGFTRGSNEFRFLTDATNNSEVLTGTDSALRAASLNLTGSGTTLDVDANANIDGTLTVDGQIISQLAQGTAPFVVASTTKVSNLNVDFLDGMTTHSSAQPSSIIARDSNGDFAANQITAASGVGAAAGFLGNASSADILKTARVITIDGVVNGNVSFDGSQAVTITTTYDDADITALAAQTTETGYLVRTAANTYAHRTFAVTASSGITLTNPDGISGNTTINVASSSTNAANNLVIRDASGGFSAEDVNVATLDATGNSTIGGTFAVTGASTLTGLLNANGGIAVNGNYFSVDGTTGAVSTASTLNVIGATTLASTVGVVGAATLFSTLSVTGDVTASADLDVTANATVGGTLGVTGATTLSSTLAVTGTSTFTGAITASGGVVGNVTGQTSDISNHDTDALSEGSTNLYFTNERVDDRIDALFVASTGITKVYDDASGTYTLSVTQADIDTDNVTEGSTNLFTTAARTRTHFTYGTGIEHDGSGTLSVTQSDINTDNITEGSTNIFYTEARFTASLAGKSTSDLTEGTNLYYTDARADARIAAATTDDLSEGSTNLYYTSTRANADFDTKLAAADTDNLSEGSTNLYFTDARADARVDAGFTAKSTSDLSEGTNQYYTEARVQDKLDNAFAQLQAMLNNLATTTTLTLNLSGDPTPGAVVTVGVANGGGGGFTAGTAVATSGGTGSSLTVDTTVVGGVITAAAVNAGGSDYLITDTVTITNPNAGKVLALNLASLVAGSGYTTGTALATTGGSGSATLTVDITANPGTGAITNVTVNDGGTGYVVGETITIVQAGGAGGTVDIATVATDATLSLTDITTMEVGATVTGATSGTTGIITALGTNQITVDNVGGFFKVGEVVSANDVTTLTISSFA